MRKDILTAAIGIGMLYFATLAKADDQVVASRIFTGYVNDPVYAQRQLWPQVRSSVFYKDCIKRGGRVKPNGPIQLTEQPVFNLLGGQNGVAYTTNWDFDCVIEMAQGFFPILSPAPQPQQP